MQYVEDRSQHNFSASSAGVPERGVYLEAFQVWGFWFKFEPTGPADEGEVQRAVRYDRDPDDTVPGRLSVASNGHWVDLYDVLWTAAKHHVTGVASELANARWYTTKTGPVATAIEERASSVVASRFGVSLLVAQAHARLGVEMTTFDGLTVRCFEDHMDRRDLIVEVEEAGAAREREADEVCREVGLDVEFMRRYRVRIPRPAMPWADLSEFERGPDD